MIRCMKWKDTIRQLTVKTLCLELSWAAQNQLEGRMRPAGRQLDSPALENNIISSAQEYGWNYLTHLLLTIIELKALLLTDTE